MTYREQKITLNFAISILNPHCTKNRRIYCHDESSLKYHDLLYVLAPLIFFGNPLLLVIKYLYVSKGTKLSFLFGLQEFSLHNNATIK